MDVNLDNDYWHLYGGQTVADAFALQRGIWEPDAVWERFIAECLDSPPDN